MFCERKVGIFNEKSIVPSGMHLTLTPLKATTRNLVHFVCLYDISLSKPI